LDCVPHPGQEVGCRLSTVTVQACSPRWTLTTFRLGVGDHETDVFITLAAAYRRKMPARRASSGVLRPVRAPRVNQTPIKGYPTPHPRPPRRPTRSRARS